MPNNSTPNFVVATLLLFAIACNDLGIPLEPEPLVARIVFGEHIEGVRIGDDSATVVRKLGMPTVIGGDDFAGGIFYYAENTKYNLMFVGVSKDTALGLGVIFVWAEPPYRGTTKDGVGIGTPREIAIESLGRPDTTTSAPGGGIVDGYHYEKNAFGIEYRDNKIYWISMVQPIRYR